MMLFSENLLSLKSQKFACREGGIFSNTRRTRAGQMVAIRGETQCDLRSIQMTHHDMLTGVHARARTDAHGKDSHRQRKASFICITISVVNFLKSKPVSLQV